MDRRFRLFPNATWAKFAAIALIAFVASLAALCGSLLGMQGYSAKQASTVLSQLESLKIGDPASSFDHAVSGLRTEAGVHVLTAGAFQFEQLWNLVWKLPQEWADELMYISSRAGLRWWRLTTSASVQEGRIRRVSVGFMVVGRYEMLGAGWSLAPDIPSFYERMPLTEDERRTHMGWFHITSMPSGEGFRIDATGQSTEKELHARRINSKCLLSFRGCDGLCDLLPRAVPVLRDRKSDWGGYTNVPRPACDPR